MAKLAIVMFCVTRVNADGHAEDPFWKDTFEKASGWDVKSGKLTFYGDLKKPNYACNDNNGIVVDMHAFCGWAGAEQRPTFEASKGHTQESFDFIYRELNKREGEGYETHVESCMAGFAEQNCEAGANIKAVVTTAVKSQKKESAPGAMVVGADGVEKAEYVESGHTCESCPDFYTGGRCTNKYTIANYHTSSPAMECYAGKPIPCKFAYQSTCDDCPHYFFPGNTYECLNCHKDLMGVDGNTWGMITDDNLDKIKVTSKPTCKAGKSLSSSSAMMPYLGAALVIAAYFVV